MLATLFRGNTRNISKKLLYTNETYSTNFLRHYIVSGKSISARYSDYMRKKGLKPFILNISWLWKLFIWKMFQNLTRCSKFYGE